MDIEQVSSGFGLITQDGNELIPPHNIIQTIQGLITVYTTTRQSHLERILIYSEIEGVIAGNPPYDPNDLLRNGLSHVANFNSMDARALVEKAALAFWNLLYETETFMTLSIGTEPELVKAAEIMTTELDWCLKKWRNFKTLIDTNIWQLVKFGLSNIFWADERDWRFDVVELSRFLVPNEASTNTDKLQFIEVETIFTPQYLFECYTHTKNKEYKEGAKATPWDVDELEFLLLRVQQQPTSTWDPYVNFMDMQQAYQDGSLLWDQVFGRGIKLVSHFQVEYDGKVSHYMFHSTINAGGILYFIDREYDSLEDAIVLFTSSPGEFTLHSNRGVGHKIFALSQAVMQMDCNIVDSTKLASSLLIRSIPGTPKDAEPIRWVPGQPIHIGSAEVQQSNVGVSIQQQMGASQYLQTKLNVNAANSGDDPSHPDASIGSISDTQAKYKSYREFNVLKNVIQHFYTSMDFVCENIVSKMLKSKKGDPGREYYDEWKRRCIRKGVPESVFDISPEDYSLIDGKLPTDWEAKATRVAGNGSTVGVILALEAAAPLLGSMGPNEILAYKRLFYSTFFGKEYVQVFTQDSGNPDRDAEGASLAQVENAIMLAQITEPLVEPAQNQPTHIVVHFELINNVIEQVKQQQMSPIEADKIFTLAQPHIQRHIEIYAQSPFAVGKIDQILKEWKEMTGYINFNRKHAQQALEAEKRKRVQLEQQQNQVMSEEQRKDWQVQKQEQRKDYQVEATVQRASKANQVRGEVAREKARGEVANQRLKTELEGQAKIQGAVAKGNASGSAIQGDDIQGASTEALTSEINRLSGENPARDDFE